MDKCGYCGDSALIINQRVKNQKSLNHTIPIFRESGKPSTHIINN